jgi:hypothetical protein
MWVFCTLARDLRVMPVGNITNTTASAVLHPGISGVMGIAVGMGTLTMADASARVEAASTADQPGRCGRSRIEGTGAAGAGTEGENQ